MDLKFSEMAVDTSLAQEYLEENEKLTELYNNFNETVEKYSPYVYDGNVFEKKSSSYIFDGKKHEKLGNKESVLYENCLSGLRSLASSLKENALLISQLEYKFRNIPIADTNAQLHLLVQYLGIRRPSYDEDDSCSHVWFMPNDPLLVFGCLVDKMCYSLNGHSNALISESRATAAICHLFITLCHKAGLKNLILVFKDDLFVKAPESLSRKGEIKGLNSGTVAVVSEDADVDSAVDKFLSTSKQAPWRLRKILVQESVYQHFKDALRWKCNLGKGGSEPIQSDVLCSDTLTYDGKTFLIDPVELAEEKPAIVTVEAYRTTKEMISFVRQDQTRYLSLWANGIAEINEVTHSTKSPVIWVNTLADFRGPPQVSEAIYSYVFDLEVSIKKCDQVARLVKCAESWAKMDIESRREILNGVFGKYRWSSAENQLGKPHTRDRMGFLTECTMKSFFDVGKDYVCMGISQPVGILGVDVNSNFFTMENFKSLLKGNAFILYGDKLRNENGCLELFEEAGLPLIYVGDFVQGDFKIISSRSDSRTRVVWTNSGTIFAN